MNETRKALPSGWAIATLKELLPIQYGKGLPDKAREPGPISVYGSSGVVGHHRTALTSGPTLMVGRKGNIGAIHYSSDPCWPIDTVYFAEGTPSTNLPFLGYRLRALELARLDKSTAVPGLSRDDYDRLPVSFPPAPEQGRIVEAIESYLSRLDAAVTGLERVKANLKRYRASVLKAAVEGRLVPTEAELARREGRSYEPASVLLGRILNERRQQWEEAELARLKTKGEVPKDDLWRRKYQEPKSPDTSGLPDLPEGWCWAAWEQVGFSQNGRAFPSGEYQADGVRLLRPGNLDESGRVEWTDTNTRYMPLKWSEEYPTFLVGPGEVVMNLTAQSLKDEFLGRVCMTGSTDHCLLNQRIARLTPIVLDSKYLLWVFKSPVFRRFVSSLNTGSLIQHMFTSQLANFIMPLPPLAEQIRISKEVDRINSYLEELDYLLEANLARCQTGRQSVLKWAFEGKLVDQDPTDEPASLLLERIKAEREKAMMNHPRPRGGRKKTTA